MRLTVIGCGYVGLVTGACLAAAGHEVFCTDIDENRINQLRAGKVPIYEEHLDEVLHRVQDGTLRIAPDGDGIAADAVIAMPRLEGPHIDGVTTDAEGFVPVDPHGAVSGLDDVWAAGDLSTFRVKQGGIAADMSTVTQNLTLELCNQKSLRLL